MQLLIFAFYFCCSVTVIVASPSSNNLMDEDEDDEFSYYGSRMRRDTKAPLDGNMTDLEELIPSYYNSHEPPPNEGLPTLVEVSLLLLNVRDIKELKEELSMEMNLRMYWKDSRLSHLSNWLIENGSPFMVLNPAVMGLIWHPDIFIDRVKSISQPSLLAKPASLRVYKDNLIRYSVRINALIVCRMEFKYYPADTQYCHVNMKSYAYTNKILQLEWRGAGAFLVDNLVLPNFDIVLDTTQNSSGTYAGIRFTIILSRMLSYHLMQIYLPSSLFVVVSWMSFFIPPENVPGRMALCMTTLLTLTIIYYAVRLNTPNVSYLKALDIWMLVCITFVFFTLIEYTILLKLRSMKTKEAHKQKKKSVTVARNKVRDIPQLAASSFSEFPAIQFGKANVGQDSSFIQGSEQSRNSLLAIGIESNGNTAERNLHGHEEFQTAHGHLHDPDKHIYTISSAPPHPRQPPSVLSCTEDGLTRYDLAIVRIERFTSTVIPALFLAFNTAYWPWLLLQP